MADSTEATTDPTPDPDEPKGLRKQLAEAHGQIKTLKADNLQRAYGELGLDTTAGFGKAIAKEYDGETTKEAVASWLKEEYEWEPEAQAPSHPAAQAIGAGQAQIDAASQGAGSVPITPTDAEALAQAEAEGNYKQTMAIKGNQIANMFQQRS